ncbi:MAG: hypothetical protein JNM99_21430 [Verrucomicrobiaceae bacterium]|nr:hypothetical protein [Verrucomicrobiaceae bacterium]
MNDCWEILGLDASTATEREVKSAYARLIKKHRPDEDPEGFQKVRQAFEAAIAWLSSGRDRGSETVVIPNDPPLEEPAAPVPPALIEVELELIAARDANNPVTMALAMAKLMPVCLEIAPGAAGVQLWQDSLRRVTEGRVERLVPGVLTAQLMMELEHGTAVITHAVLDHCEMANEMTPALALGSAILESPKRVASYEASIVALRVALLTGFLVPMNAPKLCNIAFPHVDKQARETLIPQAEQQAAIGRILFGLRHDQVRFWHPRMLRPRAPWNWDDEESQRVLADLAKARDAHWNGYNIIRQVVPEEWFAKLETTVQEHHGLPVAGGMGSGGPPPARRSSSSWPGWLTWPVAVIVINLLRMVASFDSHDSKPASLPPARPAQTKVSTPSFQPSTTPETHLNPAGGHSSQDLDRMVVEAEALERRVNQMFSEGGPKAGDSGRTAAASTAAENDNIVRLKLAAQNRSDKLRNQDAGIVPWLHGLHRLDQEGYEKVTGAPNSRKMQVIRDYRVKMHTLLNEMHGALGNLESEQRCLEAILYDKRTSMAETEVVMLHMMDNMVIDTFLPVWEDVAMLRPQVMPAISAVAAHVLKLRSNNLFTSDRDRVEALANRKP